VNDAPTRSWVYDEEGRLRSGWWVLIFLLLWKVLEIITGLVISLFTSTWISTRWIEPYLFGVVVIATLLTLRLRKERLASIGFQINGRWALEAAAGAGLGVLLMLLTAGWVFAGQGVHFQRNPNVSGFSILLGLWTFAWVALFEETLFRGFVFQRLAHGVGGWAAQGLVAAWFAYAHWGNPGMHGATKFWATLNIGLASILLGLAYLKTRSLALPIGIHLGWNWMQGNVLGFGVSGTTDEPGWFAPIFGSKPDWFTGASFGLEASLPCAVICLAFIGLLCLWKSRPLSGDPSIDAAQPPALK
jgi:membrane protease YdiL (CAAX protease family)